MKFASSILIAVLLFLPALVRADGLYSGLIGLNVSNGENSYEGAQFLDGTMQGGFAGYDQEIGDIVVGVEAAVLRGSISEESYPHFKFTSLVDAKVRLGFSQNDFTPFISGGASFATYDNNGLVVYFPGLNYGAGLDFQVTDNVIVGLEYVQRRFTYTTIELFERSDFGTLQARVALRF